MTEKNKTRKEKYITNLRNFFAATRTFLCLFCGPCHDVLGRAALY